MKKYGMSFYVLSIIILNFLAYLTKNTDKQDQDCGEYTS